MRARWIYICGLVALLGACAGTKPAIDPDASDKHYLLGSDYFSKNMLGPALEELTKALELNRDNAEAMYLMGLISLRRAAEGEEQSLRAQCLKGDELKLEHDEVEKHFTDAQRRFAEAVKVRPDFSEAHNSLSVVALHYNRADEAVKHAEKALSNVLYRDQYTAQGNLGAAHLARRDYARASKALRQALFEQPKFCVGRFRLAKVYYEQADLERASTEIEQVVLDKACPIQEAYHLAGLIALKRQDREHASQMFARCVAVAPKSCLAKECVIAQ